MLKILKDNCGQKNTSCYGGAGTQGRGGSGNILCEVDTPLCSYAG